MKPGPRYVLGVALIALGATVFSFHEWHTTRATAEAHRAASRHSDELRRRIQQVQASLNQETLQIEGVERDNAALTRAMENTQSALARVAATTLSRELLAERIKQALALAQGDDTARALSELLWCYDAGVARPDLIRSVQLVPVVGALGKLGERYPAAKAALRERFEQARRRVLGSPDDTGILGDMASLAWVLGDEQAMVAVYDALPPGDARRTRVATFAQRGFLAARRYGDALMGRPFATMSSNFELQTRGIASASSADPPQSFGAAVRKHAITSAATNIEILAGAGELAHARTLAERLLAFDSSEATRALVRQHLERAGQPGLLAPSQP